MDSSWVEPNSFNACSTMSGAGFRCNPGLSPMAIGKRSPKYSLFNGVIPSWILLETMASLYPLARNVSYTSSMPGYGAV